MSSPVITTGILDGPVQTRLEIRTLLEDKDLTNLYMLAVERMQKTDPGDPSSWFQLASIHGRPFKTYDKVGDDVWGDKRFGGYCTHTSILFPTWHRPYLALFEQILSKHVFDISSKYSKAEDQKKYKAAAERFRIPYWDWALETTLPTGLTEPKWPVYVPKGYYNDETTEGTHAIDNPLYSFKSDNLKSINDGGPGDPHWTKWLETVRYPTSHDENGTSQHDKLKRGLENERFTIRDRTYNLLTQTKDYDSFSNDRKVQAQKGTFTKNEDPGLALYDSLEAIHGTIHGIAGLDGHMGEVDYASFDPLFWMHHANVDRVFAIWQALHPNAWITPLVSKAGTLTSEPGVIQDENSDLTPFRKLPGQFWNSKDVRETHTFNYTYPELAKWDSLSKEASEEKLSRLRQDVNMLYSIDAPKASFAPPLSVGSPATAKGASDDSTKSANYEWFANLTVEKYARGAPFIILVFLGKFDENAPLTWREEPNLVGAYAIFANNIVQTGCDRCRDVHEKGTLVTGAIPLTRTLHVRRGGQDHLDPNKIGGYLLENLHFRIQSLDPTDGPVNFENVPGFGAEIWHAEVDKPATPTSTHFPVWSHPISEPSMRVSITPIPKATSG